jgi:uncharacterized protein (TIGR03086 family)
VSANLRYYLLAMFELEHALRRVPDGAWENPSPCAGWTARDVAGHAIAVVEHVPFRLGGPPARDPFTDPATIAGADPADAFRPVRDKTMRALDSRGALATVVRVSMGTMTVDEYLVPLARDAVIHAWDIAHAAGIDDRLDPDLVAETWRRLSPAEMASGAGSYGAAVALAPGASAQDRLLAATGRDPR